MLTAKTTLILVLTGLIGAVAVTAVLQRSSDAQQAPRLSLDMGTAGNIYDAAANTMIVGPIENCLTTAPSGNNTRHAHIVHLVLQDAADLVGWQARMNYDGGLMRPSAFNYNPFADSSRGQNISFLNLPIDAASGVHRDLVTASDIPPGAPGPQSALAGAVYLGEQNFAISPDTPPKAAPDDTSYSAPNGGVLAAVALQVPAGLAGQPIFTMDLDDGNPNFPGTDLQIWTSGGIQTTSMPEGSLFDGFHAEGPTCVPPAGIPAAPANDPGVPDLAPGETPGAGGVTPAPGGATPAAPTGAAPSVSTTPTRTATTTPTPAEDTPDEDDREGSNDDGGGGTPIWLFVIIALIALLAAGGYAAWRYRSRIPWLRDRFP